MSGFAITDMEAVTTGDVEVVVEEKAGLYLYKYVVQEPGGPRVVGCSPNVYAARDIALGGGRSLLNHLRKAAA